MERLGEVESRPEIPPSAARSENHPYPYRPYPVDRSSENARRLSLSLNRSSSDSSQRVFSSGLSLSSRQSSAAAVVLPESAGPSPRAHREHVEGESRSVAVSPRVERTSLFRRLTWSDRRGKRPCKGNRRKLSVWKHDFVCLAYKGQNWVPGGTEMAQLENCGLGLKSIVFAEHGSSIEFHVELMDAYAQLKEGGGYELLRRRESNSKELAVIPSPLGGYTARYLKSLVSHARIFACPLQKDLPLEPVIDDNVVCYNNCSNVGLIMLSTSCNN